jgi:5-dehydro-4-deoxyglucarate dehydratase
MTELQQKVRGVLAFPVTPFRDDLSVDYDGLERNVAGMARHDFCAVAAAGGAGEMYSLTVDEAVSAVERTVAAVNHRMPVFGTVGFNAAIASGMGRRMEGAGADGLLVMPPYFPNATEEGLIAYYEAIASSSGLPLMGYSRDWAAFSPSAVARLAERIPSLQFWKDGQANLRVLQQIMAKVGDRLVWLGGVGDDWAPAYFSVGVSGYTSGISNIAPKLSLSIGAAGLAKDVDRLNGILGKYVLPFYEIRGRVRGYEVAATKAAMQILGKPSGPVRPPLKSVEAHERKEIRAVLDTWADFL